MAIQIAALVMSALFMVAPIRAFYQADAATAAHIETENDLDGRLTSGQKEQFEAAKKAQQAAQYGEALAGFKSLLQQLPGDALITKWASDSAIEMGESAYAASLLKPLVERNFEDWQAVSMLARAAADQAIDRLAMLP